MDDLKIVNNSIIIGGRHTFLSVVFAVVLLLLFGGLLSSVTVAACSDAYPLEEARLTAVDEACSQAGPSDTLTIETGYRNWPEDQYEVKKLFTLSEIKTMPTCGMYYTFIDDSNELIIDFTWGICLTDLLSAAGVFVDDVEELIFYAENGNHQQRVTFSKEELIDTQRFCNFSLQQYYDPETGTIREHKRWAKGQVETMLAFEEAWMSPSEVTGFEGEDNLVSDNCFRLVFGQADRLERNMSQAIPHIHTVSVVLIGSAPVPIVDSVNDQGNNEAVQDAYGDNETASDTETNDEGTAEAESDPDTDNRVSNDKVQDAETLIEVAKENNTYTDRLESLEGLNKVPDEESDTVVMPIPVNTPQTSVSPMIRTTSAITTDNMVSAPASGSETGHSMQTRTAQNQVSRTMPEPTSSNLPEYLSPVPVAEGAEDFGMPLPEAEEMIPSEGGTGQYVESVPVPASEDEVYKSPDLQKTRRILCLAACILIMGILICALLCYLRSRYEEEKNADESTSYNGRIQGDLL